MSIENSYGFRSAQAAWENANPFDGECTCEGELFMCDECGQIVSARQACPELDCPNIDFMRAMTPDEITEYAPNVNCPQHSTYTDEDAADDAREHDRESRMGY
jgi:hypothetical protein